LKIIESDEYKIRVREITNFIKKDKKFAAINFAKAIQSPMKSIFKMKQ